MSAQPDRSVSDLRKEYSAQGLNEAELPATPFSLFKMWFDEAVQSKVLEPNAMCLSTVDKNGRPSGRFVLLKGLDDRGFVFYTNYESRKAEDIAANPHASLTFWWGDLERSVRVEGRVEKVAQEESEAYYWSRPRGSQMGAWASNQSRPIGSRELLDTQMEGVKERFKDESAVIPKPPHWGGYRVVPERIEFWKGRQSRFHDRIEYRREGEAAEWTRRRLQP